MARAFVFSASGTNASSNITTTFGDIFTIVFRSAFARPGATTTIKSPPAIFQTEPLPTFCASTFDVNSMPYLTSTSKTTSCSLRPFFNRVVFRASNKSFGLFEASSEFQSSMFDSFSFNTRNPKSRASSPFSLSFSSDSSMIFLPARRTRSLVISAMLSKPAFAASDSESTCSGSCTRMTCDYHRPSHSVPLLHVQ